MLFSMKLLEVTVPSETKPMVTWFCEKLIATFQHIKNAVRHIFFIIRYFSFDFFVENLVDFQFISNNKSTLWIYKKKFIKWNFQHMNSCILWMKIFSKIRYKEIEIINGIYGNIVEVNLLKDKMNIIILIELSSLTKLFCQLYYLCYWNSKNWQILKKLPSFCQTT